MTGSKGIAAAVLAAGSARRFGGDKLSHLFHGKPLAAHIGDTLAALPLLTRAAVCPVGSSARAAIFRARGFAVIDNPDPERGLSSSLALAAQWAIASDAAALLVCLADMPSVTGGHILALIDAAAHAEIVATEAAGVRSPPAVFARARLPELTALSGDRGAGALLRGAAAITVSEDLTRDIDRREDIA